MTSDRPGKVSTSHGRRAGDDTNVSQQPNLELHVLQRRRAERSDRLDRKVFIGCLRARRHKAMTTLVWQPSTTNQVWEANPPLETTRT